MNIHNHLDVINACRFCFMCRHLATLGNVTHRESDTPRGRALILDKVRMDEAALDNPHFIKTLYDAPLSGACRSHCVSSYDEVKLVLAARRDVIDANLAPEDVKALADELKNASFSVTGDGDVLYHADRHDEETAAAFAKLAGKHKTIRGGDVGKALLVLGYAKEAEAVADRFREAVKDSGAKTLVTSSPATYDALKNDFPVSGVEVLHSSEYLATLDLKSSGDAGETCLLDSDFLRNYNDGLSAPTDLLESLGFKLQPFGTNTEESNAVGEGAVVYDLLRPELAAKLCARVAELAAALNGVPLITPSPYVKAALAKWAPSLNVATIEETILNIEENESCPSQP